MKCTKAKLWCSVLTNSSRSDYSQLIKNRVSSVLLTTVSLLLRTVLGTWVSTNICEWMLISQRPTRGLVCNTSKIEAFEGMEWPSQGLLTRNYLNSNWYPNAWYLRSQGYYTAWISPVLLTLPNKYPQRNQYNESTASSLAFATDPCSATFCLRISEGLRVITGLHNLTNQMRLLFHLLRAARAPVQWISI